MLKIRYPAKFTFSNNFDIIGVQIRSFSGPYFPYSVQIKKKTEKTPYLDTFHTVNCLEKLFDCYYL